ncbi:MAG: hypothetical protein AB8U66_07120 [Rickettsiales endosymbiont of Dermacentor nuttalli]
MLALALLAEEAGILSRGCEYCYWQSTIYIGTELTTNLKIRKLSFTGSTEIGKLLINVPLQLSVCQWN